jgi:hypothetical protein
MNVEEMRELTQRLGKSVFNNFSERDKYINTICNRFPCACTLNYNKESK